jgi:hypothetical protein
MSPAKFDIARMKIQAAASAYEAATGSINKTHEGPQYAPGEPGRAAAGAEPGHGDGHQPSRGSQQVLTTVAISHPSSGSSKEAS